MLALHDSARADTLAANYHTMQLNNHRAVEALQRALRLDPSCLNAWILLGHAYVELRNSQAATEMYRHALGTCATVDNSTIV